MRLEIDTDKVDAAMAEYLGPETTGKGLVQWLLERFTGGEISTLASMNRPWIRQADAGVPKTRQWEKVK